MTDKDEKSTSTPQSIVEEQLVLLDDEMTVAELKQLLQKLEDNDRICTSNEEKLVIHREGRCVMRIDLSELPHVPTREEEECRQVVEDELWLFNYDVDKFERHGSFQEFVEKRLQEIKWFKQRRHTLSVNDNGYSLHDYILIHCGIGIDYE